MGASTVISGELQESLIEPAGKVPGVPGRMDEGDLAGPADAGHQRKQPEADPADTAYAESLRASAPTASPSVAQAAAEALHAAAEQVERERSANTGDAAALSQALKAFLDAFAGQNIPTRSEFLDLAARLERLSSQFQKGR